MAGFTVAPRVRRLARPGSGNGIRDWRGRVVAPVFAAGCARPHDNSDVWPMAGATAADTDSLRWRLATAGWRGPAAAAAATGMARQWH